MSEHLSRVTTAAVDRERIERKFLDTLRAALDAGEPFVRVAEAARMTRHQLRKLLEPGTGRARPGMTEAGTAARKEKARSRAREAQHLRDMGLPAEAIAGRLGVTARTVYRITRKP